MFNLAGKRALITGASGGIGSAISKTLFRAGASVVLSGRNKERLEKLSQEIKVEKYIVKDLSKEGAASELAEEANSIGPVDILISNAGATKDSLALRMSDTAWDEIININLKAPFILCRDFCKIMSKKKIKGRIVNISSVTARMGNPGQANYSASKAGLEAFTRVLAAEFASRNITVNCISPGFIETDMTAQMPVDILDNFVQSAVPVKRMGKPEEVAAAALYLSSDEAAYVTGSVLQVNGGILMN